ncbi:MAG: GNAT family N-acetyltransferase [Cyanobacteria bacterium J06632_22]
MKTPILKTDRLQLRPLTTADLPAVYAYSAKPEYSRFLPYPSPTSVEDLQNVFGETLANNADKDFYLWAVCLTDANALIGLVELSLDSPTEASLHYEVADRHWNQGYATEAARAALDWGFRQFPVLKDVLADAQAGNLGSRRVLEKCGLTQFHQQLVMLEKSNEKVLVCHYRRSR